MSIIDQHGPLVSCRSLLWTLLWERQQNSFFQDDALPTSLFLWPWQIVASRWSGKKNSAPSRIENRRMKLALDENDLRTTDLVWWYFHQRGIGDLTTLNPFVIEIKSFGSLLRSSKERCCDFKRIIDAEKLIPQRFVIFVKGLNLHFLPVVSQPDEFSLERGAIFSRFPRDLTDEGLRFIDSHRRMIEAAWKLEPKATETRAKWIAWSDANSNFDQMLGAKLVQKNMLSAYDLIGRFMLRAVNAKRHLAAFEKATPVLAWSPYYAHRFDFLSTMQRLCRKFDGPSP
ncbi:hypothetical protein BH09VER1_BH09VER1_47410 [soil metagenome]